MARRGTTRKFSGGGKHRGNRGIRLVALLEAAKGAVVICAGFGLMALIHRDVQAVAEDVVRHLHVNPAMHFPRIFLDAAAAASDARLWAMAIAAMLYAIVRFTEACGLWREQAWAEWFGIISGALYLPLEVYELTVNVSPIKLSVLLVNLVVVGWLIRVRWIMKGR
jgi:uncharacterized membrane protein (DUF2068 family)